MRAVHDRAPSATWRWLFWPCVGLLACGAPDEASGAIDGGAAGAGDADSAVTVVDDGYEADDDPDLPNPERGIYYWSVRDDDAHTLVGAWLYLGDACDQDLTWAGYGEPATSPVLDEYAEALRAHRAAGRKVVFRPRYDVPGDDALNGCGVFHADTWERQLAHVDAIAAMLADHRDAVAFVEAGYLGRWGEWNWDGYDATAAPFLADPEARRALMSHVLASYAAAGLPRHVELRRPIFARELLDADENARVGLYNDCFMTSDSDYGTYSSFEADNPSNFGTTAEAIAWARERSAVSPFGGETCPYEGARWESCDNMIGDASEPAALHLSYLHGAWAPDARQTWEAGGCYGEIKRRLGYRFEVARVEYPPALQAGQRLELRVHIRNTGWARMHNPRTAYLVLRGDAAAYVIGREVGDELAGYETLGPAAVSGDDVSQWAPGQTAVLSAAVTVPPPGTYELRLYVPDADAPAVTGYAVRIASLRGGAALFDAATAENALGVEVRVAR